jgi:hypothetical protein
VHALCGQLVGYSGRVFSSAPEFVDVFFAEFDREKTGKISKQAYVEGAYKSLEIISTLCLYGSALPMDAAPQLSSSSSGNYFRFCGVFFVLFFFTWGFLL